MVSDNAAEAIEYIETFRIQLLTPSKLVNLEGVSKWPLKVSIQHRAETRLCW